MKLNKRDVYKFILDELKKKPKCNSYFKENYFKKKFPEVFNGLLSYSFPDDFTLQQKLYHYFNDDKDFKLGLCKECGKRCTFYSFRKGYASYCSTLCASNSPEVKEKIKETIKNTPNFSKNKELTRQKTCYERYGCDVNSTQEKRTKTRNSNKEKYGVEFYSQTDEYKQKIKSTCQEKYGVDNVSQIEEVKEKKKDTCMNNFDVEYPMQSQKIIQKSNDTLKEKYGVENYTQTDEYKKLFENPEWSKNKINQYRETCLEKYGVENYFQTDEYLKKSYKTKKKNHSFNSSSIEEKFKGWLTENNFKFERQYRSELYPFACDFYLIDYNLYIEIHGHWTHGKHPFDKDNEEDRMTLENWKSKNTKFYNNAINVWTKRDVEKREIAKENNLNYLEIFSCKLDDCILSLFRRIKYICNIL